MNWPCRGVVADLDSVDVFLASLRKLPPGDRLVVVKVLCLGLVINGSVNLADKVILARALQAASILTLTVVWGIDLKLIERSFRRGVLDVGVVRTAFANLDRREAKAGRGWKSWWEKGGGGGERVVGRRERMRRKWRHARRRLRREHFMLGALLWSRNVHHY